MICLDKQFMLGQNVLILEKKTWTKLSKWNCQNWKIFEPNTSSCRTFMGLSKNPTRSQVVANQKWLPYK